MKTWKKAVALALCAVFLVVGTISGTLAYITEESNVLKNSFTIGDVEMWVDETKVGTNGVPVQGAQERDKVGQEYLLMPGHEYTKDPIIHIAANSEPCWLFVEITNPLGNLEDESSTIEGQMLAVTNGASKWTVIERNVDENSTIYGYNARIEKSTSITNIPTFGKFKIDSEKTQADIETMKGKSIIVKAYAVQADNVLDSSETAWNATFGANN